ncbi:hypothetical protein EIP91_004873 [Steccherinum ochraceum]|uniref:FAD-binding PCMH-type domain-containing protein n=1 Tax=Steccherinum ochraceum TaxID=92696 RepID=A0A4R0RGE0_9APHY|nr:hypothetical protein EIP91_004873 [Steccherinum ochraceum]
MSTFEDFKKQFKGDIVTPHDPTYQQALDRWAANARRDAAVVAFVKDAEDVALAIKHARTTGLRIAVRGGGHSPAGTSSSEGGLVIDLSRYLNNVRVDSDKKLIHVQGGAQWGSVDHAAIKHGLAGVAGTVNHTGVGGLAVGGGYGWLSGQHGLVIDNTVQLTVVTADGSILTASETENSDLFFGVRGGGSNFGVVTEFVFKLHPQRAKVFAGPVLFGPDKCEKLAAFLDEWWPRAKAEEGILVAMMRGPDGNPLIMSFVFYNGFEEEGRKAYKGLFDLGPIVDQAAEVPYEELNNMTNPLAEWGANYYFKGLPLAPKPSDDLNPKMYDQILRFASSPDHVCAVLLEYLPHGKINSISADSAPYRRDLAGNTLILIQWKDNTPEKSLAAKEMAHSIAKLLPQGEGYGNYTPESDALPTAGAVTADKTKALFREHYPKLQAIKKKYDPDMIFNQWYTVIPA